jgi:hypothetical protein
LDLPVLSDLVDQSRILLGDRQWQHPRTLNVLGLDGFSAESIRAYVERGRAAAMPRTIRTTSAPLGRFPLGLELIPQV